jgi:rubrerythrin
MSTEFNIEEVFEIALQIERNGAKFYKKAAKQVTDQSYKFLFLDLVDMELKHEKIFAHLKEKIVGQPQLLSRLIDPNSNAAGYLHAFADGYIFNLNDDPSNFLNDQRSLEEILNYAIGLEKDSIVFYYGLQDLVPSEFGKDKINLIIKEELKHIFFLNDKIKKLSTL